MNFSYLFKPVRWLLLLLLLIAGLLCIFFAILQSKWAKGEIRNYLLSELKQAGIRSEFSSLDGTPPFSWTIDKAFLHFGDEEEIQLSDITVRLAILPLFKGKVTVAYLNAEGGHYLFSPKRTFSTTLSMEEVKQKITAQLEATQLPFSIKLQHISLNHFNLINAQTKETFSIGITGQAKMRQDKKEFALKLHLFSPDSHLTYLETSLYGNEQSNRIKMALYLHLEELPVFSPIKGELFTSLEIEGPWSTWKAVLYDEDVQKDPLSLKANGRLLHAEVAQVPALNADWNFNTSCLIDSSKQINIDKLLIISERAHVTARGSVASQLDKSHIDCALFVPDLAPWVSFPLLGSLQGKASYEEGHFSLLFKTKELKVDSLAANTVFGKVNGVISNSACEASISLSSEDALIPFDSTLSLLYSPEKIAINSFLLSMGKDSVQGNIVYDPQTHLYEAAVTTSIQECERFELLFKDKHFYGQLSSELTLLSDEGKQKIRGSLTGHHLRYKNLLLDDLSLDCEIKDPFKSPSGKLHLLAEKMYIDGHYAEKVMLDTQSTDSGIWPFTLSAQGRIETPFSWKAIGTWQKDASLWTMNLNEWTGELLEIPFSLEHPTALVWKDSSFELNSLDAQVGLGHVQTSAFFSQKETRCSLDIQHFPLDVLRCFHPQFGLTGFLCAKGFLEGNEETDLHGAVNAVLEEASITHPGKKEQFQSKGSFQAHLDNNRLQIHTDLRATDAQFLDFTASLPTRSTSYPFSLELNSEQSTSAELIAEGKLENLFDFINLGTSHFTGLISGRLFLSQTLLHPSLLGNLTLQNGTYENYFTGIALKSIQAKLEAESTDFKLKEFTAQDDESGAVSASGRIELKPKEHFPYHFDAELDHLHTLNFDMIDCHLSGPFYLTGNTQEMLAQGNLLIDKAKIQVTERLPYEVPTLPFSFIHKPHHLDSMISSMKTPFLCHLDIELTADNKIQVEGRGLNAELEGDIHLHGTNTHIAANGELHLVKGEYIFAGRVFKLTEANMSFNDKSTPSSYLNVSGTLSLPEVVVTAMMHGPLTSPQLTFQSNPHLPTSSILALILFNKDISEINQMEAVLLASTLISFSGGAGPDVLNSIRKTIGVDRFSIAPGSGSDLIAVQIGKYLMRGVMVTLSQSEASTQVSVEVELPKGFVFQAENQNEKEGKFSLKWKKSY